jgi:hypothetical protein
MSININNVSKHWLIKAIMSVEPEAMFVDDKFLLADVDKAYDDYQLHILKAAREDDREYAEEMLTYKYSTEIVINGHGGFHRYYVRGDGEVVFSEFHSWANAQEKALAAGFKLFK